MPCDRRREQPLVPVLALGGLAASFSTHDLNTLSAQKVLRRGRQLGPRAELDLPFASQATLQGLSGNYCIVNPNHFSRPR